MINHKKITDAFDLISKVCAVATAAAIVLSTAATSILFPATAIFSFAAGNWRTKFNLIFRNPISITFLLFYTLFVVGAFYSTAPWADILLTLRKYDKFLLGIFFIPLFLEKRWRDYAINTFLIAIFILLVASYLREFGWLSHDAKNGVVEIFKCSIEFNFLMAFAAYLCSYKIIVNKRHRWLFVIFLLLVVYTILFRSVGRSGYFVFIGLMVLFFFQRLRWRGLLVASVGAVLFLSLVFVFSPIFKERINAVFSDIKVYRQNENTSVGLRMSFVKNSIKLIKAHPIFGTGTGSFTHEYAAIKSAPTRNPHNEYIYITVQFGVLGLVMLLLLFGIPLWYSRFLSEELKFIVRGVVLGIMLGCLANSWLLDTTEGHFYVYFMALAFGSILNQKKL